MKKPDEHFLYGALGTVKSHRTMNGNFFLEFVKNLLTLIDALPNKQSKTRFYQQKQSEIGVNWMEYCSQSVQEMVEKR